MLTRKLMVGLGLVLSVAVTGCSCCKSGCNTCASPSFFSARVGPAPCNSCGGPPPAGVVVPPPPAAVVPAPAPAPGPYGASYERRT